MLKIGQVVMQAQEAFKMITEENSDTVFSVYWPYIGFIIIFSIIFFPMFLNSGPLVYLDWPSWNAVIERLNQGVLHEQETFWPILFKDINAGMLLGRMYSLPLILPWLFSNVFSISTSLKICFILSFIVFSCGLFRMLVMFFPVRSSFLGALLYTFSCGSWIGEGMWYNIFSLGIGCFFFVQFMNWFTTKRIHSWVLAVLFAAITVYSHPIGAFFSAISAVLIVAHSMLFEKRPLEGKDYIGCAGMFAAVIVLSLPQLYALSFLSDPFPYSGQYKPKPLMSYLAPSILWLPMILFSLWNWRQTPSKALFMFGFVAILLLPIVLRCGRYIPISFPGKDTLVGYGFRFRLVYYLFHTLLATSGLHYFWKRITHRWKQSKGCFSINHLVALFWLVVIITPLAGDVLYELNKSRDYMCTEDDIVPDFVQEWRHMCDIMRQELPNPQLCRVYIEDPVFKYPGIPYNRPLTFSQKESHLLDTHFCALLASVTSIQQINGFSFNQGSFGRRFLKNGGGIFGERFEQMTPSKINRDMQLLNCGYLIMCRDSLSGVLDLQCEFLRPIFRGDYFTVYRHRNTEHNCYAWKGDVVNAKRVDVVFAPDKLSFCLSADEGFKKGEVITISHAFATRWYYRCAGREFKVLASPDSLMTIIIPFDYNDNINVFWGRRLVGP